jgi:hypothetical protein
MQISAKFNELAFVRKIFYEPTLNKFPFWAKPLFSEQKYKVLRNLFVWLSMRTLLKGASTKPQAVNSF